MFLMCLSGISGFPALIAAQSVVLPRPTSTRTGQRTSPAVRNPSPKFAQLLPRGFVSRGQPASFIPSATAGGDGAVDADGLVLEHGLEKRSNVAVQPKDLMRSLANALMDAASFGEQTEAEQQTYDEESPLSVALEYSEEGAAAADAHHNVDSGSAATPVPSAPTEEQEAAVAIKEMEEVNVNAANEKENEKEKKNIRDLLAMPSYAALAVILAAMLFLPSFSSFSLALSPAQIACYGMGMCASLLYIPIILKMFQDGHAEGMSYQTWIFSILGYTAGVLYPLKKGFMFATYFDGVVLTLESLLVLGMMCHYQKKTKEFVIGTAAYFAAVYALAFHVTLPAPLLNMVQIGAIAMCNYAGFPQIALQFKTGKATWPWMSALGATGGNAVKAVATIKLTGDAIILGGCFVGVFSNALLLLQTIYLNGFKNAKKTPSNAEYTVVSS